MYRILIAQRHFPSPLYIRRGTVLRRRLPLRTVRVIRTQRFNNTYFHGSHIPCHGRITTFCETETSRKWFYTLRFAQAQGALECVREFKRAVRSQGRLLCRTDWDDPSRKCLPSLRRKIGGYLV